MYKVFSTETFDREIQKLPEKYRLVVEKVINEISINPYVGKQLTFKFLREKRIKEKRIYYLVYDDLVLVLLVAVSGKKDQQDTINHIKEYLPEFKKFAEKVVKQFS